MPDDIAPCSEDAECEPSPSPGAVTDSDSAGGEGDDYVNAVSSNGCCRALIAGARSSEFVLIDDRLEPVAVPSAVVVRFDDDGSRGVALACTGSESEALVAHTRSGGGMNTLVRATGAIDCGAGTSVPHPGAPYLLFNDRKLWTRMGSSDSTGTITEAWLAMAELTKVSGSVYVAGVVQGTSRLVEIGDLVSSPTGAAVFVTRVEDVPPRVSSSGLLPLTGTARMLRIAYPILSGMLDGTLQVSDSLALTSTGPPAVFVVIRPLDLTALGILITSTDSVDLTASAGGTLLVRFRGTLSGPTGVLATASIDSLALIEVGADASVMVRDVRPGVVGLAYGTTTVAQERLEYLGTLSPKPTVEFAATTGPWSRTIDGDAPTVVGVARSPGSTDMLVAGHFSGVLRTGRPLVSRGGTDWFFLRLQR